VAKADVLARVRDDLALGHTYVATQRLRTLLAVDPNDVEVYRLLASVYRQTGNLVEAGRWAYLTDDLREEERAAFEHAHASPWLRLRLLRWTDDPAKLPSEAARQRLVDLIANAEEEGPPDRYRTPADTQRRGVLLPCLFVLLVLGAFGTLAGLGVFSVLRWLIH
jgi:hypothetical protein